MEKKNKKKIVKKKKIKKGFTLIELLAVIIILGVIMLIAIPSVTRYINESRKKTYIDTARQYIKGAITIVNSGELDIYDTSVTYYIPTSCINVESGGQSPFGGELSPAYILVTYDNNSYNFYWMSTDNQNVGVKTPTTSDRLDISSIETGVTPDDVRPVIGIDGRKTIIEFESDCSAQKDPQSSTTTIDGSTGEEIKFAAAIVKLDNNTKDQLTNIGDNILIFNGSNPDNYVKYDNELWRILAVENNRLKIFRVNKLDGTNRLARQRYNNNITGNEWADSTLNSYLNQDFYNTLSSVQKNMIYNENSWNVGNVTKRDNGETLYQGAKTKKWIGKIGLIAAYEYVYASDMEECYTEFTSECGRSTHNWLTKEFNGLSWTISPSKELYPCEEFECSINFHINGYGFLNNHVVNNSFEINPVLVLKDNVKILGGTGTSTDPYILELE